MLSQRCEKRQHRIRGTFPAVSLLVGLGVLGSWPLAGGSIAWAEPAANMVRPTQDAAVEQILKDLEARSIAGRGVWQTTRTRQDKPVSTWLMGQGEQGWYLKCADAAPSPLAGYTLVGQDQQVYSLADGRRLPLSSLRGTEPGEYQLSHWLLQVNLRPRQMLGLLGDLRSLGRETIDGVGYIHLQTAPPVPISGSAAMGHSASPQVDLYYDIQHQTISRVTVGGPSGVGEQVTVTQWGKLGTANDWPTQFTGQRFVRSAQGQKDLGEPLVTTVDKFTPGNDPVLAQLGQQIAQTPFFVTARQDLRPAETYEAALAGHPENVSDRLALAAVRFQGRNLSEGLKQWQTAEQKLSEPDRQQLAAALAPYAAEAVWFASSNKTQAQGCPPVLVKLQQSLPDAAWRNSSVQILWAWQALHRDAAMTQKVGEIEKPLLGRLVQSGQTGALQLMLEQARKDPKDAALLEPYFQQVAQMPLPASGYANSQASTLVAASLAAGDTQRASTVLKQLHWDPRTAQADKVLSQQIAAGLEAGAKLKAGQREQWATLIQQYARLEVSAKAQDPSSQAARTWLVSQGVQWVQTDQGGTREARVQLASEQITKTAQQAGAKQYWDQLLSQLTRGPSPDKDRQTLLRQVVPLAKVYGQAFQSPGYESGLWLQLASGNGFGRPGEGDARLKYLDQALATAADDAGRMQALRRIAEVYLQGREPGKALQIVQSVSSGMTDPKAKAESGQLLASLKAQEAKDQEQATAEQKQVEQGRAKGRVAFLQQQLAEAHRQGRSAQDIASLEQTLQRMQSPQGAQ